MSACCPHSESEHEMVSTCQHVTHYPSEDYPCVCSGFSGERVCDLCGHERALHHDARVCRPVTGDYCSCRSD